MDEAIQKFQKFIDLEKLQPPRPGLIPQSGDYERPFRWVRPEHFVGKHKERQTSFVLSQKQKDRSQIVESLVNLIELTEKMSMKTEGDRINVEKRIEELKVIEWAFLTPAQKIWNKIIETYHYKVPENGKLYPIFINSEDRTEAAGRYGIYDNGHIELFYLGTNPENLYWNPNESNKRRGAGTALIKELIKIAKAKKAPAIGLYSEASALPFYKKMGFRHYRTPKGENRMILRKDFFDKVLMQ